MMSTSSLSFLSLSRRLSFFCSFGEVQGVRTGDEGESREEKGKVEGEKSLRHPLPIMDKLRSHSEKDQKWIKDIEHFSSKATRRRAV